MVRFENVGRRFHDCNYKYLYTIGRFIYFYCDLIFDWALKALKPMLVVYFKLNYQGVAHIEKLRIIQ